jgi:PTH1 family peptidyl-tRNA hydrolase
MKLIVGLGNPGAKYSQTRHNAGFMAVEHLAKKFGFDKFKMTEKHKAETAEGQISGLKALLIKPQTFMNNSGQAVQSVMSFYKLKAEDIIVVYDDVDLPFEKLRIRPKGSAGNHKGMKSVIEQVGGQDFIRIRLGTQPPASYKGSLEDYVLGKLTADQKKKLSDVISKLPSVLEVVIKEGTEKAMNEFNS